MTRKPPSAESLRLLYVRCGNECAFPGCNHPIFNDSGLYIAQLCHIKAANKGGQRYDETQTDEERKSPENLMFMCHRHHKETDDIDLYDVEALLKMKSDHEKKYTESGKRASEDMIRQVRYESNYFWNKQEKKEFELEDLKIEKDFDHNIESIFDELERNIETINNYCTICADSDKTQVIKNDFLKFAESAKLDLEIIEKQWPYNNPLVGRNWELHNIGRPNYFSHLSLTISQMKVKVYEELVKLNPEDEDLKFILEVYRHEFEEIYDNAYYVD